MKTLEQEARWKNREEKYMKFARTAFKVLWTLFCVSFALVTPVGTGIVISLAKDLTLVFFICVIGGFLTFLAGYILFVSWLHGIYFINGEG